MSRDNNIFIDGAAHAVLPLEGARSSFNNFSYVTMMLSRVVVYCS